MHVMFLALVELNLRFLKKFDCALGPDCPDLLMAVALGQRSWYVSPLLQTAYYYLLLLLSCDDT